MKIDDFTPHIKYVLEKMCEVVTANPKTIDFKEDEWFMKHTWGKGQEKAFSHWLAKYLYGSKDARIEMLYFNRKNLKHCEKAADYFVWNYGWKYDFAPYKN